MKTNENPRVKALSRMLSLARFIRKQGGPEEADEALHVEKQLSKRLEDIEKGEAIAA